MKNIVILTNTGSNCPRIIFVGQSALLKDDYGNRLSLSKKTAKMLTRL